MLVCERSAEAGRRLIALNPSHAPSTLALTERRGRIIRSSHVDRSEEVGNRVEPRADEGILISPDADQESNPELVGI
jgi:hypothetical protein